MKETTKLSALQMMNNPKNNLDELWLKFLYKTSEMNLNYNRLKSFTLLNNKCTFNYVKKTLEILKTFTSEDPLIIKYVEEVLKWSDVAKCGLKSERKNWLKQGFNLQVHNLGSADIYKSLTNNFEPAVYLLIKTHGLIGQYIQGEVNLEKSKILYSLIKNKIFTKEQLRRLLTVLNYCILNAVKDSLYESIEEEMQDCIEKIVSNKILSPDFYNKDYLITRIKKLRKSNYNDNYTELNKYLSLSSVVKVIGDIFKNLEIWYFETALNDFSLEEIVKIFLIINAKQKIENFEHLTFTNLMKTIYWDWAGHKVVNIYKRRIIEAYLKSLRIEDLIKGEVEPNKHIAIIVNKYDNKTLEFNLQFTAQATKLIEFCEVSFGSDESYNKAVFFLYDLFNLRRDVYDRFYNETDYLNNMNSSLTHKSKILDYIKGNNILDVGSGGGTLMDLILSKFPTTNVKGIDISENVIQELIKRKNSEKCKWDIIQGDALNLKQFIKKGSVDTIIYSSIIHELFSYIETDDEKFNYATILKAINSAYEILPVGGRIIIRDGIMTEPVQQYRLIEFKNIKDINILNNYCNDFKGRKIAYELINTKTVKMLVNDAMEFLYTYTWGPKSYALEVNEQFGYFTPTNWIEFFDNNFNDKFKLIELRHFLQEGYEENLMNKISIYDESYNPVSLPDSTCILAVEKIK